MILPLYGCRKEENDCNRKETCVRYGEEPCARLWSAACNIENNYLLYIKKEEETNEQKNEEKTIEERK